MKLEKWALLAEVISGVAILTTLIVLVLDVRSNGRLMQRQLDMERLERRYYGDSIELIQALEQIRAIEPESNSPGLNAYMERYDLSFQDAMRWASYVWRTWVMYETDFLAGDRDGVEGEVADSINLPEMALYWDLHKEQFDEGFVEFAESLRIVD
jgi:hypothetical protein